MSTSRQILVMFIALMAAFGLAGCGSSGTKIVSKSCGKSDTTIDIPLASTVSSSGGGSYTLLTDSIDGAMLTGTVGSGEIIDYIYVGSDKGKEHTLRSNLPSGGAVNYSFSSQDFVHHDITGESDDHVSNVRLCLAISGKVNATTSDAKPGQIVKGSSAAVGVKDENGNISSYTCRSDLYPVTLPIGQKHEFDGSVLSVSEIRSDGSQQAVTVTLKLNAHQTVPAIIVETKAHKEAPNVYPQTALGIRLGEKGSATFKLDPSAYADNYLEQGITSVIFCVGSV